MSPRRADVVWTLTSPEVHHSLLEIRGWTREQYETAFRETLERVGRLLDLEQGAGQLGVGAGGDLKNAHALSMAGRTPPACRPKPNV